MLEFVYFLGIVFGCVCLPAVFLFRIMFKKSIAFTNALLMMVNSSVSAVLVYFIAKFGLIHSVWAGPVAILVLIAVLYRFQFDASKPIKDLCQIINRLSKGDFSVEINNKVSKKENEIGQIARELDNMLQKLKESVRISELVSTGRIYSASKATESIENKGDLDKAISDMTKKLNEIILEINDSSGTIAESASELSKSSQSVSTGATQQAASIEEISSSMEEMVASINQNADNAFETEQIAMKATSSIDVVKSAVDSSINSMKEIADKIDIVSEIAAKTDLLAINAAIEAARAGEYGKGFAIVAGEVRNLAESSRKASESITELAVKTVKEASLSGELLKEVVPEIQKNTQLVQEIAASSQEQRNGASQINTALIQLNQVTQENAASSEELSSSAEVFSQEAEKLKTSVHFFKLSHKHEGEMEAEIIKRIAEMNQFIQENYRNKEEKLNENKVSDPNLKENRKNNVKQAKGTGIDLEDDLDKGFQSFD